MCHRLYAQGDLADEHGHTLDQGGVPLERFQCELCPQRIMPDPDAITRKAQEVYGYLAQHPFPEHPPDLTFLFRLVGLKVGSEDSREVYARLLTRISLEREHRENRAGQASTNGQQSS